MEKQIRSRADFHRVLHETHQRVKSLVPEKSHNQWLKEIWFQLDAMVKWTKDGRAPARDERQLIKIGPISAYALCPANDDGDLMPLRPTLSELHWYFFDWPEDAASR